MQSHLLFEPVQIEPRKLNLTVRSHSFGCTYNLTFRHIYNFCAPDFLFDVKPEHWDTLLVASIKNDDMNKLREHVYLWLISTFTEDEIDQVQKYYLDRAPQYIKECMVNNTHYRVLTAIACDLGMYNTKTSISHPKMSYFNL